MTTTTRAELTAARTRNCGLRKTGHQERRPLDLERLQRELSTARRSRDSGSRGRGR